jgi:site-specific DNA-methyltransferase (adenine-specific)
VVGDSTVGGGETLTSFRQALYFQEIGFRMYDTMIYQKRCPNNPPTGRYFQVFEYMFVLSKGKPKTVNLLKDRTNKWYGQKRLTTSTRRKKNGDLTHKTRSKDEYGKKGVRVNVWMYSVGFGHQGDVEAFDHPATFPEALAGDHILSWSNPGDTVLDPMMGSGTVCKMAILLDRNAIGYEISAEYFEIASKRVYNAMLQPKLIPFEDSRFSCDTIDKDKQDYQDNLSLLSNGTPEKALYDEQVSTFRLLCRTSDKYHIYWAMEQSERNANYWALIY